MALRIRNTSYAIPRLLGAAAMLLVLAGFLVAAFCFERPWHERAIVVGIIGALTIMALVALSRAAWWVRFDEKGVAVRFFLSTKTYPWDDLDDLRFDVIETFRPTPALWLIWWIPPFLPALSHKVLRIRPKQHAEIVLLIPPEHIEAIEEMVRTAARQQEVRRAVEQ